MSVAIRDAAQALIDIVMQQCGGYTSGPGFDAAEKARVLRAALAEPEKPIDMILHCPACLEQHIDAPEHGLIEAIDHTGAPVLSCGWRNPPHRSHLCKHCGFIWRPADVATNGVAAIKTKGKDDMLLLDGPQEVMRQIRIRDAAQPKLDWDGERP